jgi:hypothetical protein
LEEYRLALKLSKDFFKVVITMPTSAIDSVLIFWLLPNKANSYFFDFYFIVKFSKDISPEELLNFHSYRSEF